MKMSRPHDDINNYILDDVRENVENKGSRSELDSFRQQWIEEVKGKQESQDKKTTKQQNPGNNTPLLVTTSVSQSETKFPDKHAAVVVVHDAGTTANKQTRADQLYQKGIRFEIDREFQKAVSCYRRAIQIDRDVESRMRCVVNDTAAAAAADAADADDTNDGDVDASSGSELTAKLSDMCLEDNNSSSGGSSKEVTSSDLVSLPPEVLFEIFRCVIGGDVDLRSLECLASTCRRLYVLSRDSSVWRSACKSAYGRDVLLLPPGGGGGGSPWRSLLMRRPYPRMDGVYVSKVSYFQEGDPTVMSDVYEPFKIATYFRFIRFLPDGRMISFMTSEEPRSFAAKFTAGNVDSMNFRCGGYHVTGSNQSRKAHVCALLTEKLTSHVNASSHASSRNRHRRGGKRRGGGGHVVDKFVVTEKKFDIQLELSSDAATEGRRSNRLSWKRHMARCLIGGEISELEFNLREQHPPFHFRYIPAYNRPLEAVETTTNV